MCAAKSTGGIDLGLEGRVALVTGAGAGIGREIARWLARAGCPVAVNDIDPQRATETARALLAEGARAIPVVADVRSEDQVSAMIGECRDTLGSLDIAVNNVGMNANRPLTPFVELDAAHWRDVVEQNLIATALCCVAEARAMLEQSSGGVILNVSSGETTRPSPQLVPYGAAKAGINHLTQSMAAELGPQGIRVLAMAPGTTVTEKVREVMGEDHLASIAASNPLRRMTEPEELGRMAVFLASDLARCVTGQFVLADAGAHLSRSRPDHGDA
ncbi:SDR family oxidoreductase [Myxococcota bacterium]|nr:SDR family oxidoreductase [Myxococcota bacterium]